MSRKYKFHNPEGLYFITLTVKGWTDVFLRNEYKHIFIDNLSYCQKNKGLEVFSYCIMTSHIHMIVRTLGNIKIQDIIRQLKVVVAKDLKQAILENPKESRREWLMKLLKSTENGKFQFWEPGSHPIELWTKKVILQKMVYIHNNPVEQGFVLCPEDYPYSSARDYNGDEGYVEIVEL